MQDPKETVKLRPVGAKDKDVELDDYDPHLHRNAPNPTSNWETTVHLLKGCLGTGILAMPEAFKNAGMINGFVFTCLIGILCTYGLHLLVKAQYVLCKRMRVPLLTYPESMKLALLNGPRSLNKFADYSPLLVDVFLIVYQLGICCCYIVFVGVNLKDVLDVYLSEPISVEITMLICLIPFILINLIRNLKLLAPFSSLANVLTFVSFGIILYYIFKGGLPTFSSLPSFGSLYTFPLFFGTTLFALEAVGVVIAVENNMKTPKSFGGNFGVLNVSMFVVTVLYAGMGLLGYWKYGNSEGGVKSSITLQEDGNLLAVKLVRVLYAIAVYISYGLQCYPSVEILWNTYIYDRIKDSNHLLFWEYVLRVAAVLVTFVLAVTIPLLGLFISLFGAFCLSALGIAFPAIMDLCVKWPDQLGPGKWILIKDILLIIIGVVGLLAGTYSCMSEIIRELSK